MTECGFLHNFMTCSDTAQKPTDILTFPHFSNDVHPNSHSAQKLCLAAMPALHYHTQILPLYDLHHHLLYHTLYGAEPFSRAANNTTSRGVNLFLSFSVSLLLSTTSDAAYV